VKILLDFGVALQLPLKMVSCISLLCGRK